MSRLIQVAGECDFKRVLGIYYYQHRVGWIVFWRLYCEVHLSRTKGEVIIINAVDVGHRLSLT